MPAVTGHSRPRQPFTIDLYQTLQDFHPGGNTFQSISGRIYPNLAPLSQQILPTTATFNPAFTFSRPLAVAPASIQ